MSKARSCSGTWLSAASEWGCPTRPPGLGSVGHSAPQMERSPLLPLSPGLGTDRAGGVARGAPGAVGRVWRVLSLGHEGSPHCQAGATHCPVWEDLEASVAGGSSAWSHSAECPALAVPRHPGLRLHGCVVLSTCAAGASCRYPEGTYIYPVAPYFYHTCPHCCDCCWPDSCGAGVTVAPRGVEGSRAGAACLASPAATQAGCVPPAQPRSSGCGATMR